MNNARTVAFALGVILLIACLLWKPLGLLLLILAATFLVGQKTKLSYVNSFVLAILCTTAYIGVLEFILELFGPDTPNFDILHVLLTTTILPILYFSGIGSRDNKIIKKDILSPTDVAPILATALSFVFLIQPMLNMRNGADIIYFLSNGEDNASHFAMINRSIIEEGAPYLDDGPTGLIAALKIYPQGFHSSVAYGYHTLFDNDPSITKKLVTYLAALVGSTSLLVFTVSSLIMSITRRYSFRLVLGVLAPIIMLLSVGVWLFIWGFMSQIMAFAYLFGLALLLLAVEKNKRSKQLILGVSFLLTTGIVFSWYLLLPIACLMVLSLLYKQLFQSKDKASWVMTVVFAVCSVGIISLNTLLGKGVGGINEPGGVHIFEPWVYVVSTALCVAYLLLSVIKKRDHFGVFNLALFGTLFSTLCIGMYQMATVGELRYYYFKIAYLLIVFAFIVASILIASAVSRLPRVYVLSLSILSLSVFTWYVFILKPDDLRVYVNDWYVHSFTPKTISKALDTDTASKHKDILFMSECTNGSEYLLNRWTGAIYLSEDEQRGDIGYASFHKLPNRYDLYSSYAKNKDVLVLKDTACIK